jgi:hypothetical protein
MPASITKVEVKNMSEPGGRLRYSVYVSDAAGFVRLQRHDVDSHRAAEVLAEQWSERFHVPITDHTK